ncbi:MAG: TetR/AcrR family transcriptional regulator [Chitinophagaceae bacterium]|nr:TetR/AcrR family transcriptional regulator [Oligoflexus sp.]
MRYKSDHKGKARALILGAAGRRLRKDGYDGVGVHGLMEDAGMTTGAFYSHFSCKEELLLEVLREGLEDIRGKLDLRVSAGEPIWIDLVLTKYFSKRHCIEIEDSCILPALTVDAARAGDSAKALFHQYMVQLVDRMMKGLRDKEASDARARAWTVLSLMVGAVTIARALPSGEAQDELLTSVRQISKLITHS